MRQKTIMFRAAIRAALAVFLCALTAATAFAADAEAAVKTNCSLALIYGVIACLSLLLPLYYKEVSLQIVGGAAKLHKVYGPLQL